MKEMISTLTDPRAAAGLGVVLTFFVVCFLVKVGWTKITEYIKNLQIIQGLVNNFRVVFKIMSKNIGYILIGLILIYGGGSLLTDWYVENIKSDIRCEIGRGSRY